MLTLEGPTSAFRPPPAPVQSVITPAPSIQRDLALATTSGGGFGLIGASGSSNSNRDSSSFSPADITSYPPKLLYTKLGSNGGGGKEPTVNHRQPQSSNSSGVQTASLILFVVTKMIGSHNFSDSIKKPPIWAKKEDNRASSMSRTAMMRAFGATTQDIVDVGADLYSQLAARVFFRDTFQIDQDCVILRRVGTPGRGTILFAMEATEMNMIAGGGITLRMLKNMQNSPVLVDDDKCWRLFVGKRVEWCDVIDDSSLGRDPVSFNSTTASTFHSGLGLPVPLNLATASSSSPALAIDHRLISSTTAPACSFSSALVPFNSAAANRYSPAMGGDHYPMSSTSTTTSGLSSALMPSTSAAASRYSPAGDVYDFPISSSSASASSSLPVLDLTNDPTELITTLSNGQDVMFDGEPQVRLVPLQTDVQDVINFMHAKGVSCIDIAHADDHALDGYDSMDEHCITRKLYPAKRCCECDYKIKHEPYTTCGSCGGLLHCKLVDYISPLTYQPYIYKCGCVVRSGYCREDRTWEFWCTHCKNITHPTPPVDNDIGHQTSTTGTDTPRPMIICDQLNPARRHSLT